LYQTSSFSLYEKICRPLNFLLNDVRLVVFLKGIKMDKIMSNLVGERTTVQELLEDTIVCPEKNDEPVRSTPFKYLTWAQWQDMQRIAIMSFTEFQRAVDEEDVSAMFHHALKMQEVSLAFQEETCFWSHCLNINES
jgi:hypothetical protein